MTHFSTFQQDNFKTDSQCLLHIETLKCRFQRNKSFRSMCKSVSLEITNIRQTMVKYPAAAHKCRTMRHFRHEPFICDSLQRAAAAQTKSRADNRAQKKKKTSSDTPVVEMPAM